MQEWPVGVTDRTQTTFIKLTVLYQQVPGVPKTITILTSKITHHRSPITDHHNKYSNNEKV